MNPAAIAPARQSRRTSHHHSTTSRARMPSHHTEIVPIGLIACEHWSTVQPATPRVGLS